MVDLIATEYEAKCSALIVVVNAQADAQRGYAMATLQIAS